jgi:hypothetical protein
MLIPRARMNGAFDLDSSMCLRALAARAARMPLAVLLAREELNLMVESLRTVCDLHEHATQRCHRTTMWATAADQQIMIPRSTPDITQHQACHWVTGHTR